MRAKNPESRSRPDGATISYPCVNPRCTYHCQGTGYQFKAAWRFACPECKTETLVDPDNLEFLLGAAWALRPRKAATAA